MYETEEQIQATRLLEAIENGRVSPTEIEILAQGLDPVFIYVIISFVRAVYPATDPAATAVLDRVVAMTRGDVVRRHKQGAEDPISKWFESEHGYASYRGRGGEMLALVGAKLEA